MPRHLARTLIPSLALALASGGISGCRHGETRCDDCGRPQGLVQRMHGCRAPGGCPHGEPQCVAPPASPRGYAVPRPEPRPHAEPCPHCGQIHHHHAPGPISDHMLRPDAERPAILGHPVGPGEDLGHSQMNEGETGARAALTSGTRIDSSHAARRKRQEFDERWFSEAAETDSVEPWPYHGVNSAGAGGRGAFDSGLEPYPHSPVAAVTEGAQTNSLVEAPVEPPRTLMAPPSEASPLLPSADSLHAPESGDALPIINPGPSARR